MTQRSRDDLRRRRKRILLLALLALVLLVSPLFALSTASPNGFPAPARVVVAPGDTLWDLAKEYGPPNEDVRQIVWDIRETNRLDDSLIRPGQVLLIETK